MVDGGTMIVQIWAWADSHQSSYWPWLHNISTSATLAKGEDYRGCALGGGGGFAGGVTNLGRLAVAGFFYVLNRVFR